MAIQLKKETMHGIKGLKHKKTHESFLFEEKEGRNLFIYHLNENKKESKNSQDKKRAQRDKKDRRSKGKSWNNNEIRARRKTWNKAIFQGANSSREKMENN